jgi:hypothetical protein
VSRISKLGLSIVGAAVALSLSACGSDGGDDFADQSAATIMDQAEKDTKALKSVTVVGTVTQDDGTLDIDLSADDKGTCTGTLGIGGGEAEVLSVGDAVYIRGDEAFWRSSAGDSADQVMALLGDKWAKLPQGQKDSFDELCDLDQLFDDDEDDDKKKYTKGEVTTVGGKDALEILVKEDGEDDTRAWIATEGKHYLLKIEQTGGDEPGSMELSDFNEPVDAEEPAEDEYVDLSAAG